MLHQLTERLCHGLQKYREELNSACIAIGCFVTNFCSVCYLLWFMRVDLNRLLSQKTGVSGAGRSASVDKLLTELTGNFKAYNPLLHRHIPEIEQELNSASEHTVQVQFTPHLIPVERGIFSTIYASVEDGITEIDIIDSYKSAYQHEPFVHVLDKGELPQTCRALTIVSCIQL